MSTHECGRDSGQRGGPDSFPFELSRNVGADAEAERTLDVPYDGRIVTALIGWGSGANNLVGVQIRTAGGVKLLPRNDDEYITANDFTYAFSVRTDVNEDDEIVVLFKNTDTNNDHYVNCILEITKDGSANP
jgi:hypothetical protein